VARQSPPPLAKRKRLFFTIFVITIPILVFVMLEVGLRFGGYGPDLSLFRSETENGKTWYSLNPDVKSRYFSHYKYNPSLPPDQFSEPKEPGTYRIFCLGGSTTVGYPYWYNGSFSSFLRDRLQSIFPGRNIEIVNVGMTATNSFTVNDMARDLVRYKPDLFIVYDGHNEFYGALGIASHESLGKYRWLTDLSLRLIHLKTFVLLRSALDGITSLFHKHEPQSQTATLMETLAMGQYIPYGSNLYRDGMKIFRENLEDLKSISEEAGVPVILASQVSNLRGLKPFISLDNPSLTPENQSNFKNLLEAASAGMLSGKFDSAMELFTRALGIDSLRADAEYGLARCLDTLGRKREALEHYRRARDFDQLRFRASTDLNSIMMNICDGKNVLFADMEKTFAAASPDSIIGNELITEHLHPNSRGYFLLAKEYASVMRQNGLMEPVSAWAPRDTISDSLLWAKRPITDLDEKIAARRTEVLTSGWPFRSQVPTVNNVPVTDTLGQVAEFVTTAKWTWVQAHEGIAQFYEGKKDFVNEEREYSVLIDQLPGYSVQHYLKLAWIYLELKRYPEMESILKKSLEFKPTILANRALADLALRTGRPLDAIRYYRSTLIFPQSQPEQVENRYLLALAYSRADSIQRCKDEIVRIFDMNKGYKPALELLQQISAKH
jgi:tetratricopeptide (TPR) repeat protein